MHEIPPPKITEELGKAQAVQPEEKKPYKKTLPKKQRKPRKQRRQKGAGKKY